MNVQLFLSILYLVALGLPAFGIGKAFLRAREEHKKYDRSNREEQRISDKYRIDTESVKSRREEAMRDGTWGTMSAELIAEEKELEEKIRLEMESHGVDRITYARFNEALYDMVRNHPKSNYFLRVNEIVFVGSGIVVGSVASIWSLWI